MPHALALSLAVILVAASPLPPVGGAPEAAPPSSAIVGGHHIQPRASGSGPDVPPGDADQVDRLYQQLMRETAPDAGSPEPPAPSR